MSSFADGADNFVKSNPVKADFGNGEIVFSTQELLVFFFFGSLFTGQEGTVLWKGEGITVELLRWLNSPKEGGLQKGELAKAEECRVGGVDSMILTALDLLGQRGWFTEATLTTSGSLKDGL